MRRTVLLVCVAVGACILQSLPAAGSRRLQEGPGSQAPLFPAFTLPGLLKPQAPAPAPEPLVQAQSGIGKFVFNTQLPQSATNLGLGAVAFPGETKKDLLTTVASNITLFLEQQFEAGKCKDKKAYCQGVSDAFWQMLVDDLTSSSQGFASASMTDDMITKLHNFFYVFQPKGLIAPPPDVVAKVLDNTPSPPTDPTNAIVDKIASATSDLQGLLQKLTGFAPPPGGFGKVLEKYFGSTATVDGAAAAAAGAAGGR
ncbi:g11843 [Coccomyxa elongata]